MSRLIWKAMGLTILLGSSAAIGYYTANWIGSHTVGWVWGVSAIDSDILLNLTPIISGVLGALVLYVAMRDDEWHQIAHDGTAEFQIFSVPLARRAAIWVGWFFLVLSAALSFVLVVRGEQ
jgi:hypothetical protein